VDQRFPPNDHSLFKQPRPEGSNIKWLRLKDVMDEKGKGPIHWKVYFSIFSSSISVRYLIQNFNTF
jgi:hypothetical protein